MPGIDPFVKVKGPNFVTLRLWPHMVASTCILAKNIINIFFAFASQLLAAKISASYLEKPSNATKKCNNGRISPTGETGKMPNLLKTHTILYHVKTLDHNCPNMLDFGTENYP